MPSVRSAIHIPANQLRDPFLFEENGHAYLLYAVSGEAGIGIAKLEIEENEENEENEDVI